MTIKQLITLNTDVFGEELIQTQIVSMDRVLTQDDTKLIEYVFGVLLDDEHSFEIELVDDIEIKLIDNMILDLFIFEKTNNKYSVTECSIPLNDLSSSAVSEKLINKKELVPNPSQNYFFDNEKNKENSTFVFDKNVKPKNNFTNCKVVNDLIIKNELSQTFVSHPSCYMNDENQRVQMQTYFFPELLIVIEYITTCLTFDKNKMSETFLHDVNIINDQGKIIYQDSFEK